MEMPMVSGLAAHHTSAIPLGTLTIAPGGITGAALTAAIGIPGGRRTEGE